MKKRDRVVILFVPSELGFSDGELEEKIPAIIRAGAESVCVLKKSVSAYSRIADSASVVADAGPKHHTCAWCGLDLTTADDINRGLCDKCEDGL